MAQTLMQKLLYRSPLELSINTKMRYAPIVAAIKKIKKRDVTILEIGSGSQGITRFIKRPVVGLDVQFDDFQGKHLKKIHHSATDRLPFGDGEFDIVVSVDCLEHIPKKDRIKALEEMKRVAKEYVFMTFPCEISKWDQKVLQSWDKGHPTYKNIKEHLDNKIPDGSEVKAAFKGWEIEEREGTHPAIAYYIKLSERTTAGKALSRTAGKLLIPILNRFKSPARRYFFIRKPQRS